MDGLDPDTSIARKLIAQLAVVSGLDQQVLSPETSLDEIGLDSTLLALTLRAVEIEFAIEFGDDEVARFLGASSIGDYIDILQSALSSRPALDIPR